MQRILTVMLLAAVLVACSGDEAAERTPAEAMNAASVAVLSAPSFSFQVSYVGDPVDVQAGLALDRVDGVFEAPNRSRADVRVKTLGLTAILEVVTEGDRLWQKVPFAEDFVEVAGGDLITGTDIFSEDGLGALLREDVTELAFGEDAELEEFPGETFQTVTGIVSGQRLNTLTLGYLQGTDADVKFYLAGDEVRRIVIDETDVELPRSWTIDLWAYGQPVDIVIP